MRSISCVLCALLLPGALSAEPRPGAWLGELLSHRDVVVRRQAVRALTALGPDAEVRSALARRLADPDRAVRREASRALDRISPTSALFWPRPAAPSAVLAEVIPLLRSRDPEVVERAARVAAWLAPPDAPELIAALDDLALRHSVLQTYLYARSDPTEPSPAQPRAMVGLERLLADPGTAGARAAVLVEDARSAIDRIVPGWEDRPVDAERGQAITRALADADPLFRRRAVLLLARWPNWAREAHDDLAGVLTDPDAGVRAPAAVLWYALGERALGPSGPPIADALLEALDDPLAFVRASAADMLAGESDLLARAVPALVARLGDDASRVREAAGRALAKATPRPPAHVLLPTLHRCLRDPSRRSLAALVLLLDLDPESQTTLRTLGTMLDDSELAGRAAAALCMAGPTSLDVLRAVLRDGDLSARWLALRVLAVLGPDARPALDDVRRVADPRLENEAARTLGRMGPAAVPALLDLLRLPTEVNEEALKALDSAGEAAGPVLVEALRRHPDTNVRLALAGRCKHPAVRAEAVAVLTELARSRAEKVRAEAGERLLSRLVKGDDLATALRLARDRDAGLRRQAFRALSVLLLPDESRRADEVAESLAVLTRRLPEETDLKDAAGALLAAAAARPEATAERASAALAALVPCLAAAARRESSHLLEQMPRLLSRKDLADVPVRAAVRALADALPTTRPRSQLQVLAALERAGPRARPASTTLRPLLEDRSETVRLRAAGLVWEVEKDPRPVRPVLTALLNSSENPVRFLAAGKLWQLPQGPTRALPVLLDAVAEGPESTHCHAALDMLVELDLSRLDADQTRSLLDAALRVLRLDSTARDAEAVLVRLGPAGRSALFAELVASQPVRRGNRWRRGYRRPIIDIPGLDESALPEIRALMREERREYRVVAVELLGQLGERGLPELVELWRGSDSAAAEIAGEALLKHPAAVLPAVAAALDDPDPEVRRRALRALAEINTPVALDEAVAGLADPVSDVRQLALDVIAQFGAEAAKYLPDVRPLLGDPDAQVRFVACRTVRLIGGPDDESILPAVRGILRGPPRWERVWAARWLAEQGGTADEVIPVVLENLGDHDHRVREWSFVTLVQLARRPDASAALVDGVVRELSARATNRAPHQISALISLRDVGRRVRPALNLAQEALAADDEDVRRQGADLLSALGPDARPALPRLRQALADPAHIVRPHVAAALLRIDPARQGPAALAYLRRALRARLPTLERDDELVGETLRVLANLGAAARPLMPELLDLLRPGEPAEEDGLGGRRFEAGRALWRIDPSHPGARFALRMALTPHMSTDTVVEACSVLAGLGPAARDAEPALRKMLQRREVVVRRAAGDALRRIK